MRELRELSERLARCYTGAVHDVLRMMGHDNIALPPDIKAIGPGTRLAGAASTDSRHIDRERAGEETLLARGARVSKAPPGHVLVCQRGNSGAALMGGTS